MPVEDLDPELLAAIRAAGDSQDTVTLSLAKGMQDAASKLGGIATKLADVLALRKAEKKDEPENKDDTKGKDEPAGGGDNKPGYEDMDKAIKAAREPGATTVDVTASMLAIGDGVSRLEKALAASVVRETALQKAFDTLLTRVEGLEKGVAANAEQSGILAGMISDTAAGTAAGMGELAKGLAGTRRDMLAIPENGITPNRRTVDPKITATPAAYIGGSRVAQSIALQKGLKKRIISADQLHTFNMTGKFVSEDEAGNTALREKIVALAA